jgi:hypothetical protein
MMSKLSATVAGLVVLGGVVAAGPTASAGTAPPESAARIGVAAEGRYAGQDNQGNHIRFDYQHGRMSHFHINHHGIGGADVLHGRWSTSCTDAYYCSWGEWETSERVRGGWNQGTHGGTARHFTVHLVHPH